MDALLIVDMLNDFAREGAPLYCGSSVKKIIPFIAGKIKKCRSSSCKVIYLCDSHDASDKEFKRFRPHSVKGTPGSQVITELKPKKGDAVIKKTTLSAFYKTTLEKELKKLKPKVIYLTGVCTSICIMDAAGELKNRGYEVIVYKDGVTDFDKEAENFALKRMKKVYGARIE